MRRDELEELHYITPIANVPSILRHGILSHARAKGTRHQSVAMEEIQDRRSRVVVPKGRRLHEYANLYVCARNPMMYKRQDHHKELCVLIASVEVMDLPGVVITDGNASSEYVRFASAPKGLSIVDREWTFADDWTDSDQIQYFRKKAAKCAEVLVPDRVTPDYILGAYVSCKEAVIKFQALNTQMSCSINSHIFFR